MPDKTANKLTVKGIAKIAKEGKAALYNDGNGLYLKLTKTQTMSWVFRFRKNGRLRDKGLGSFDDYSLAEARERARECRLLLLEDKNPIIEGKKQANKSAYPSEFGAFALYMIDSWKSQWKNEKHIKQWYYTINVICKKICKVPIQYIDTDHVLSVLKPIWEEKPETAKRARSRINQILDAATVKGLRIGENPARWKGHLEHILISTPKIKKHHDAARYQDMKSIIKEIKSLQSMSALALEFLILTAARTNEVIFAELCDFNIQAAVWTIPAEKMKAARPHRVPLVPRAIEIVKLLKAMPRKPHEGQYLFVGGTKNGHLSNQAMSECLKGLNLSKVTVHGFRSSFRDWAGDLTEYPRETAEVALAHSVGNAVEQAYRRSDAFKVRRAMMMDWFKYLGY